MKRMNEHEDRQMGLKEKAVRGIGNWLAKMAVDQRTCRINTAYEPKLSSELISELVVDK